MGGTENVQEEDDVNCEVCLKEYVQGFLLTKSHLPVGKVFIGRYPLR